MKKSILSLIISLALVGCGAGASGPEGGKTFSVDIGQDKPAIVEGLGASVSDQRHDAVAYVVSSIKPGTEAYRAMQGHGLAVVIDGKYTYVVTMRPDGLHIVESA